MLFLAKILPYIQIVLVILLAIAILLQQSEASLGAAFGGDSSSSKYTRRGADKVIFQSTIVLAILFAASCALTILF